MPSPANSLPLIRVQEHPDQRRHPRFWPPGMIGTLRFAEGEGYGPEFHYIGLNLSQSGAAIIIAPEEDTLPSARGEINIFLRKKHLHRLPFRVVRSRRIGRYMEVGLTFHNEMVPLKDLKDIEEYCLENGLTDLADPKTYESLSTSTKHEE